MHIEKKWNLELFVKLHMLLENIYKEWWGQQSSKKASNQQKLYTILVDWLWRVRKSLFRFCSLNGECVTCVCLQYSRHKQNRYHFLGKTTTIDIIMRNQLKSHFYSLLDWPNTGEHFKLDPSAVDKCKLELWLRNVSACSVFSVWLLYKSIFLLAWLSSAITSKLLAWFSWNFKYPLFKHCI